MVQSLSLALLRRVFFEEAFGLAMSGNVNSPSRRSSGLPAPPHEPGKFPEHCGRHHWKEAGPVPSVLGASGL